MNQMTNEQSSVSITCSASAGFEEWIAQAQGSLAVTTYQAGKVAMLGYDGRQMTLLMRHFDKPLGLAVDSTRLALATRHDVTIFANAPLLAPDYLEDQPGRYDALYLPRVTYHTGNLNTHDVSLSGDDLLFVNTRFSCLARVTADYHFTPFWRPKFIGDTVPEDRCHLNGMALVEGRVKYVTALGTSDTAGGWRENKANGGVLLDVESDAILLDGLSMPHSPRWHRGLLWVLNSGTGELLVVDPADGKSTVVCRLPGYLRGLCFAGPYALVGLCKIRESHIFGGLPIQEGGTKLLCGIAIIDLRTGSQVGLFEFTSGCEELYEVQFLPGVLRPMILNLEKPSLRQTMTNPESSYWLRPSSMVSMESNYSNRVQSGSQLDEQTAGEDSTRVPFGNEDAPTSPNGDLSPGFGTQI